MLQKELQISVNACSRGSYKSFSFGVVLPSAVVRSNSEVCPACIVQYLCVHLGRELNQENLLINKSSSFLKAYDRTATGQQLNKRETVYLGCSGHRGCVLSNIQLPSPKDLFLKKKKKPDIIRSMYLVCESRGTIFLNCLGYVPAARDGSRIYLPNVAGSYARLCVVFQTNQVMERNLILSIALEFQPFTVIKRRECKLLEKKRGAGGRRVGWRFAFMRDANPGEQRRETAL